MPDQSSKSTLGPLPRISTEKIFEQESLDALRRELPANNFLIRDERLTDYGVDASLELIHESSPTNIRCLLQLKARHGLSANLDGTISLSIESSNLNYLLNSPSSLIVLFDGDSDTFYWCLAQEEMHRLRLAGISLTEQSHVTLRLRNTLTDTKKLLFETLLDSCLFERRLREELRALPAKAFLHINATREIVAPTDAERNFFGEGWKLANEGNIDNLLRLHSLLADEIRSSARAQLLLAFAYYAAGRPFDARAHLIQPLLSNDLTQEDCDLAGLLRINTDFLLGETTRAGLNEATQILATRASPAFRLNYEINFILSQIDASDLATLSQLQARAIQTLALAISTLGARHPVTLLATLAAHQVKIQLLLRKYITDLVVAQEAGLLGELLRNGESPEATRQFAQAAFETCLREVEAIAVVTTSWPSIHGEAQFTRCMFLSLLLPGTTTTTIFALGILLCGGWGLASSVQIGEFALVVIGPIYAIPVLLAAIGLARPPFHAWAAWLSLLAFMLAASLLPWFVQLDAGVREQISWMVLEAGKATGVGAVLALGAIARPAYLR